MRGTGLVDDDSLFQRVINPNLKQLLLCYTKRHDGSLIKWLTGKFVEVFSLKARRSISWG